MKLRPLYNQLLTEIGDSSKIPSNAKFVVGQHGGNVQFKFLDDNYKIEIRVPILHENKVAITIDFYTTDESNRFKPGDYKMTNRNQPLKSMAFIVGSIEEWLIRYKNNILKSDILELNYLKFDPKSESDEENAIGNKRDRLYRTFIEKFSEKYGSKPEFSTSGGITAKFNPPLTIK